MTDKDLFPVWDDKYNKLGVTPRELYMRQQGLCYLIPEVDGDKVILCCTDGKDKAETSKMLNPTFECMKCISRFTEKAISDAIKNDKQDSGKNTSSNDT